MKDSQRKAMFVKKQYLTRGRLMALAPSEEYNISIDGIHHPNIHINDLFEKLDKIGSVKKQNEFLKEKFGTMEQVGIN